MKTQSFISACIAYFGLLPDQNKLAFGREMQALTDSDRLAIWEGLKADGIMCDKPLLRSDIIKVAPALEGVTA